MWLPLSQLSMLSCILTFQKRHRFPETTVFEVSYKALGHVLSIRLYLKNVQKLSKMIAAKLLTDTEY